MSLVAAPGPRQPGDGMQPPRRLRRERRTIEVMIGMYCRAHHDAVYRKPSVTTPGGMRLCPECAVLLDYSDRRIDACRFAEAKPTCAHCTVHCFRATERERIREVMRHAGPRMMLRHPYLALTHLLDGRVTPQPTQ